MDEINSTHSSRKRVEIICLMGVDSFSWQCNCQLSGGRAECKLMEIYPCLLDSQVSGGYTKDILSRNVELVLMCPSNVGNNCQDRVGRYGK